MSNVIDLSDPRAHRINRLAQSLAEGLSHPDQDVLNLWKSLATKSLKQYPGAPTPSKPELSISFSDNVTQNEIDNIVKSFVDFFSSYKNDVNKVMLEMLSDIMLLQKEVAEYRTMKSESD